jgi:RimJ/RimL family protein N-acetyltransferase
MPYQPESELATEVVPAPAQPTQELTNWRNGLPTLGGTLSILRELQVGDAPGLLVSMSNDEVSRFISPPPMALEGFERFIDWSHRERAEGRSVAFAVVRHGLDRAIGLFQVRALEPNFSTAEWGFAMAVEHWGTGLWSESAELVVDFAFEALGVRRLEARAALKNARGNSALRKMGAAQEGVLRRSFLRHGENHDQALWTICRDEWLDAKDSFGPLIVH